MKISTDELKKLIKIHMFGYEFFSDLTLNLKPQTLNIITGQ
jgi:hypothetical protein